MPKSPFFGLLLVILFSGCGSSSAQPAPTVTPVLPTSTNTYSDTQFHFSFRYPSTWHVAARGKTISVAGVQTYAVPVSMPGNDAQINVTVDANVIPFPAFPDGKVGQSPGDPTHRFRFFHRRTSGWPSMYIQRFVGGQIITAKLNELDTITNTAHRSYDVKMVTGTPPFAASSVAGYQIIQRSLTVPFS